MKETVSCKDVMRYVCECLAQDTSSERCLALKEHLDNCGHCREYFNSVKLTIDCYQKYNVELPDNTHKKLMDFLKLDKE
jgi:predicted anti-sigma-YlaC factor YlaD